MVDCEGSGRKQSMWFLSRHMHRWTKENYDKKLDVCRLETEIRRLPKNVLSFATLSVGDALLTGNIAFYSYNKTN